MSNTIEFPSSRIVRIPIIPRLRDEPAPAYGEFVTANLLQILRRTLEQLKETDSIGGHAAALLEIEAVFGISE